MATCVTPDRLWPACLVGCSWTSSPANNTARSIPRSRVPSVYPEIEGSIVNGSQGQLYVGSVIGKPLDAMSVRAKYKGEFVEVKEDYDRAHRRVLKRLKGERWYVVPDADLEYPRSVKVFVKSYPVNVDESVPPKSSEVWFTGSDCDTCESSGSSGSSWSKTVEFIGPRIYDRVAFMKSHFCGMSHFTEEFMMHLQWLDGVWSIIFNPENYDVQFNEGYEGYVSVSSARMKKEAHERLDAALDAASKAFVGRKYKVPLT